MAQRAVTCPSCNTQFAVPAGWTNYACPNCQHAINEAPSGGLMVAQPIPQQGGNVMMAQPIHQQPGVVVVQPNHRGSGVEPSGCCTPHCNAMAFLVFAWLNFCFAISMVADSSWSWSNCAGSVSWGLLGMQLDGTTHLYSTCELPPPLGSYDCSDLQNNGGGVFAILFLGMVVSLVFAICLTMQNYGGKVRFISHTNALIYLGFTIVFQALAIVIFAGSMFPVLQDLPITCTQYLGPTFFWAVVWGALMVAAQLPTLATAGSAYVFKYRNGRPDAAEIAN